MFDLIPYNLSDAGRSRYVIPDKEGILGAPEDEGARNPSRSVRRILRRRAAEENNDDLFLIKSPPIHRCRLQPHHHFRLYPLLQLLSQTLPVLMLLLLRQLLILLRLLQLVLVVRMLVLHLIHPLPVTYYHFLRFRRLLLRIHLLVLITRKQLSLMG